MVSNNYISMTSKKLLISVFYDYFIKKNFNKTEHFILDRLFPDERRTTSVMSGLQTSLGSYWEKLAVELATENGFKSLSSTLLKQPKIVPEELASLIEVTKSNREGKIVNNLNNLKDTLAKHYLGLPYQGEVEVIQKGRGCDLIFEKNNNIFIIDTKTVQVNAGNGNTFSENLIRWVCYYAFVYGYDARLIHPKIVFPYNSSNHSNDTGWWKEYSDRIAPLTNDDVWVGNEFWSFITNNNDALKYISHAINCIKENPEFIQIYKRAFLIKTKEETNKFRADLKIFKIKAMRNVEFLDKHLLARKNLQWRHNDCTFKAKVNDLLNADDFVCPSCSEII